MNKNIQSLINSINKNPCFIFIKKLVKDLPTAEIYLVGGSVRDALLGQKNKDFDFIVTGIEKEKLEEFLKKCGQVKEVDSRSFGVFKFKPKGHKGEILDVALPRKERRIGPGYKDFKIETSAKLGINDDLSRRDFTINAIALNFKNGNLIDKFNGLSDLKKGIIQAVGKPQERFLEDPSRILRAIRFACQLDFDIEEGTLKAAIKLSQEITKKFRYQSKKEKTRVSSEIIAIEFVKGFNKNPVRLIKLYNEIGILKLILPEVLRLKGVQQPENFHSEGDVWNHTMLSLKKLNSEVNINVKLAVLFHDIGKPNTQTLPVSRGDRIRFHEHDERGAEIFADITDRLKLSSSFPKDSPLYVNKKEIFWLIKNHMICVNNPQKMRPGTIEKYFFKNKIWGKHLLELSYADISATITARGRPDFSSYDLLKKKIAEVEKILKERIKEKRLAQKFPQLLDGYEVQKIFNLKPGPMIGRIKDLARYLQLENLIKTKKDILKNKEKFLEACQNTKTTDKAEDYIKKIT